MEKVSCIYIGNKAKPSNMRVPQDVPQVDEEQEHAAYRMFDDGAKLLFSDPGAGKTLTALTALDYVHQARVGKRTRTLVFCPTIAVRNWATWTVASEAMCDRAVTVQILRSAKDKIRADADMVICTYGLISRVSSKVPDKLREWTPHVVICDESDALNNKESQRTKVVLDHAQGLAADVEWAWFLTGTPIPRYQDGLWPVLFCRFKQRLRAYSVTTYEAFKQMFCFTRNVKYGGMRFPKEIISGNRNTRVMHDLLYGGTTPIAIRNKLKLRDAPVIREITLDVEFSPEFTALETKVQLDGLGVDENGQPTDETSPDLVKALRMLGEESAVEVANYAVDVKQKLPHNSGILVLFWHRAVGDKLVSELRQLGYNADMIRGDTPQNKRDNLVDLFNEGRLPFLVGQIAAMGVALNLQKSCNTVIFAEETFSDAANRQAFQRVWRRGQDKVVNVIFCRTLSSLSDIRPNVAAKKARGAAAALDGATVTEV